MRVLLVEDDSATAMSIELMLKSEGFNCYTTDLGAEAIDLGKIYDYDIILLDLGLPDMSGLDVLRSLRVAKIQTPIMIVSGTTTIDIKVKCFTGGADDYLSKPFHKDELVARIHAIIRRSRGHAQSVITTGNIVVNLDARTVTVHDRRVHLTGKEYQMLELLSLRKGTTLTKEMFLNHLYGGMNQPELKIIDVFISRLRKKIKAANKSGHHHIETVWGRGYVLRDTILNLDDREEIPDPAPDAAELDLKISEAVARFLKSQENPCSSSAVISGVRRFKAGEVHNALEYLKDTRGFVTSAGEGLIDSYALTPEGLIWLEQQDRTRGGFSSTNA